MTDEELDDLLDRLPARTRAKVLDHLDPDDLPEEEEYIPPDPVRYWFLKMVGCFLLGTLGLVLGIALIVASVGAFLPVAVVFMFLCVWPLALLFIHIFEWLRGREANNGGD